MHYILEYFKIHHELYIYCILNINAYNQCISGFGRKRTSRNLCAELLFLFQAKKNGGRLMQAEPRNVDKRGRLCWKFVPQM